MEATILVEPIIAQVKQVIEIRSGEVLSGRDVNQHLKDGWILLGVHSEDISSDNPPSQVAVYVLGWPGPEGITGIRSG